MDFKIESMMIPLTEIGLAAQATAELMTDGQGIRLDIYDRADDWRKVVALEFNERGELVLNIWTPDAYAHRQAPDQTSVVLSTHETCEMSNVVQGEASYAGLA